MKNNVLNIKNKKYYLSKYKKIFIIGAGKASSDMAFEIEKLILNKISSGIVIDTKVRKLKKIKVVKGTHPLPSKINVDATKKIYEIASKAGKNDLILFLLSGGASSLLHLPVKSLQENLQTGKALLKNGVNINDMNIIRRHMSKIKEGNLSKISYQAKLVSIIF